ncbi:MarR family winged helix-turn-helix transcriptional regulator [Conexibacter sp. DBS9H8]|uniref:MarR family winged helix-turn-helix transcriptional regulator n=1 Tax=Conexibacter sp. DBS9H8 TaxID=2937801 RepID=UPI00200E0E5D|nr:MarR family transcriptional regulator [Conexibacter sp. DBS9H8]
MSTSANAPLIDSRHGVAPGSDADAGQNFALASDLRVVIGQMMRRLRTEQRFGLTQTAVLARLERHGPQPTGLLARAEGVRPQSMSQTVAELEAAGFVSRGADASDGRRSLVSITPAGRAVLEEDRVHREGFLAELIHERLSEDERVLLRGAVELLGRISEP